MTYSRPGFEHFRFVNRIFFARENRWDCARIIGLHYMELAKSRFPSITSSALSRHTSTFRAVADPQTARENALRPSRARYEASAWLQDSCATLDQGSVPRIPRWIFASTNHLFDL